MLDAYIISVTMKSTLCIQAKISLAYPTLRAPSEVAEKRCVRQTVASQRGAWIIEARRRYVRQTVAPHREGWIIDIEANAPSGCVTDNLWGHFRFNMDMDH